MEVLLNKLFDKHSEGYGVYDRENLIKDICKELQNLQLQQTGVMARFNVSEDELIKELEDKRICKLSDLPEDIYYLHRKETARWLLEKYDVFKK